MRYLFVLLLVFTATLAGAYPAGVNPAQVTATGRDYAVTVTADNQSTGTLALVLTGSDWAAVVQPGNQLAELVLVDPGTYTLEATWADGSLYRLEAMATSDFNRPLSPEMAAVVLAVKVAGAPALLEKTRAAFRQGMVANEVPELAQSPMATLFLTALRGHLERSNSPEDFVRRAVDDLRTPPANVLDEPEANVPLGPRLLFLGAVYAASREILTTYHDEITTTLQAAPEQPSQAFLATFQDPE